jgi:hypothetical protein
MLIDMGIDIWNTRNSLPAENKEMRREDSIEASAPPHSLAQIKEGLAESQQGSKGAAEIVVRTSESGASLIPNNALEADRIQIYFIKKGDALYLSEEPITDSSQSFLKDILLFVNWQINRGKFEPAGVEQISEFRWPVVATSGTPQKAITAFLDKHISSFDYSLVLCDRGALRVLKPWLPDYKLKFFELPELSELLADADAKRRFWSELSIY